MQQTWTTCAVLALFSVSLVVSVDWDVVTPLDEYVNRPDEHYSYEMVADYAGNGYHLYVINMTSQKWLNESYVLNPIWWHFLTISIPDSVIFHDAAFVHISGGNMDDDIPSPGNDGYLNTLGNISKNIGAVAAYLRQVPNQPTFFTDDNVSLPHTEDLIIAHSWKLYIESPLENPPHEYDVLFPMVKAAIRAFDTVASFASSINPLLNIDKFLPSGSSKRGWTTWLSGCVDRRVFSMAPRVFDLLDFENNLHHHYQSYGGWSWAFSPYWIEGVAGYLINDRALEVGKQIDPLEYKERLSMPKLIITASSDEFFLIDGSHYFFDRILSPKFMMILENSEHSQSGWSGRINSNIEAFFVASLTGFSWPRFTWTRSETIDSGRIDISTSPVANSIKCWRADTTNRTKERRDFRKTTLVPPGENPIEWLEEAVNDEGNGVASVEYAIREEGYRGFFIQANFNGPLNREFTFTTEVHIIPDVFPYPRCTTYEECQGILK